MKSMYLIVNKISSNNIRENMERQESPNLNAELTMTLVRRGIYQAWINILRYVDMVFIHF